MKIPFVKGFDEAALSKYLKNTGWLMLGKLLAIVVGLIIGRYLGPSSFGDLSFADALTAIVAAVGTLGLDTFIIREIINNPSKKEEILGTSLVLRMGVNLFLIPLTVGIYLLLHSFSEKPGNPLTWIVLLLSFASFFKSFNIIDSYYQSQVKSKYVVHVQNSCLILSSLVKILLLWLKTPLIWFAAALTFDSVILALGLVFLYQSQGHNIRSWTFSRSRAISLLKQSFPLILSGVMVLLYMKIDILMLKKNGSTEVGIYSAAARISEAWYFIPSAIISSVFPAIINARKTDLDRYNKRLKNLYDLLVFISLPVAILVGFFGNEIIHFLWSNKYEGAGPMLSIHIWSGIFVFLGSASSQYLLAEGYTTIAFQRTAAGAVINILLNFWLIPLYGGVGASIATLIACITTTFWIIFIPKTRQQGLLMLKSLFMVSLFQKFIQLVRSTK